MGAAGTPTFHGKGGGGAPSGPAGGDLTGFYPNPTLVATGVVPGTYGDATHIPRFIVDGKGRITFVQNVATTGTSIDILDEGIAQGAAASLNFVGANVTAAVSGGAATISVTGSNGIDVSDEGTPLGTADTLDFVGAGVTATFAAGTATITIPGGSSGADCTTAPDLLCLAGRTGTTNDPIISTDATGTIYGTSATGFPSAVFLGLALNLRTSSTLGPGALGYLCSNTTTWQGPNVLFSFGIDPGFSARNITINDEFFAPAIIEALNVSGNFIVGDDSLGGPVSNLFAYTAHFTNPTGVAKHLQGISDGIYSDAAQYIADGAACDLGRHRSFDSDVQYKVVNGGTLTLSATSDVTASEGFRRIVRTDAGVSLANDTGFNYHGITGSATVAFTQAFVCGDDETSTTDQVSYRSRGPSRRLSHKGPAVFGDDAAPTGAYILEAIGDVHFTGKLTVGGAIDPTDLLFSGVDNTFEGSLSTDGNMLYNTDTSTFRGHQGGSWHSFAMLDDIGGSIFRTAMLMGA